MTSLQDSNYHRVLRVASVVVAVVLVFESGLLTQASKELAQNTHSYLANAIGISASVQPTELNQLTAALTQKEQELAAREAALAEREIAVDLAPGAVTETTTYIMASILFILLLLIVLNYTLDYLRAREEREMQPV